MQRIITTDDLREAKQHGAPDFPMKFYIDDTREFYNNRLDWHWHNEFEILTISEGTAIVHIDSHSFTLNSGEGLFINSSILHQFASESYAIMPNILFSPAFIAPVQSTIYQKYVAPIEDSTLSYLIFRPNIMWHKQILELLHSLFYQLSQETFNELYIRTLLSEIWLIMLEYIEPSLIKRENSARIDFSYKSVPVMIQYIQIHYADEITLKDVAAAAKVSKNTAIRYFNARIGCSPIDYLIQYRISIACRLLRETADKVTHIAASVGYTNTSYFCRLFKKTVGLSPKEYRFL
ncbi:AraC family transcriptional regulator [Lachnospiraceae bacterium 62-35]